MSTFTQTGGGQLGWVHASWPLVKLSVSPDVFRLSGLIVGTYEFQPEDIIAIEPCGFIPIIGHGIRIVHSRADSPSKIIFWCLGNPEKLVHRIQDTGFPISGTPSPISTPARGFPLNWRAVVLLVVLWNVLLLTDWFVIGTLGRPGPLTLVALLLVFVVSHGTKSPGKIQAFVLAKDHSIGEVRPLFSLLELISGIMFVTFALVELTTTF